MAAPLRNVDDSYGTPSKALNERARSLAGFEPSKRSRSDSDITEGMVRSFSYTNWLLLFLNIVSFFCTAPPRKLCNSRRHPFVLVRSEIVEITGIVNFLEAVPDPFIRNQVHGITTAMLETLEHVPGSLTYLGSLGNISPPLLDSLAHLAHEVRREPTISRRNAYLCSIKNTILDWTHRDFPYFGDGPVH